MPFDITNICINSKRELPAQKLSRWYLFIWLKAVCKATPRLLSSICINGSPLIKTVTSYMDLYFPSYSLYWFITCNLLLCILFLSIRFIFLITPLLFIVFVIQSSLCIIFAFSKIPSFCISFFKNISHSSCSNL